MDYPVSCGACSGHQAINPRPGALDWSTSGGEGGQVRTSGSDVCDSAKMVGSGWATAGADDVLAICDDTAQDATIGGLSDEGSSHGATGGPLSVASCPASSTMGLDVLSHRQKWYSAGLSITCFRIS
ncbi:hypothetical protein ASPFODRAFT_57081 [Aspergillus luchuensis CBS 106.47]|uniref:Uncharacterized protein n=1 Tax=Aspergillus luchuensis (strain CBS 106.47) TaxID=1137211 RepID=A0A1M3TVP3_ASPLC|nr:hypothetical protein ASPFODRAFT_57081 [Aspergillus luchuensis CBS 106.47]